MFERTSVIAFLCGGIRALYTPYPFESISVRAL
jgi:hypothetical protein